MKLATSISELVLLDIIRSAGAQWVGQMVSHRDEVLVLFRDPSTGSTCALPLDALSADAVKDKLAEKRQQFSQ